MRYTVVAIIIWFVICGINGLISWLTKTPYSIETNIAAIAILILGELYEMNAKE